MRNVETTQPAVPENAFDQSARAACGSVPPPWANIVAAGGPGSVHQSSVVYLPRTTAALNQDGNLNCALNMQSHQTLP
uniref:Uncharacterized protein n=1 Tax=Arundo donax TaxID=35708 RepID=A0A0A9DFU6_ARUDO